MDDPTTTSVTEGFGLMFYREASLWDNARWYDPALGRFAQADTIVPGGVQGWDRYAYVNNNPILYNDPSGHEPGDHCDRGYCIDKRDLTGWMTVACVDAAKSVEIKEIAMLNSSSSFALQELGPGYSAAIKKEAFEKFAELVSNDKKFDVKVGIKDDVGDTIKLGDNWYEYSTAGNILYGFYGLAAGFSKFELHGGAGYAQVNDIFAKGNLPGGPSTLFDTKGDYYAIEFGFFLYENYYDDGILTGDEFLDALSKYEDADKLDIVSKPKDYQPTKYKHPANQYYQP